MRRLRLSVLLGSIVGFVTPSLADVNHGDFLGTNVDFLAVTESTQTVGDPEPMWQAPIIAGSGDQLAFFPQLFISECLTGASDTTESLLTTTITAVPGVHIETIALVENGDATLTSFPPFGDPTTNATAALTGFVTVTEDIGGPIVPVVIPFSGTFAPSDTFVLPGDFGNSAWSGSMSVDVVSVVPNATRVELSLTNSLATNCGVGGNKSAKLEKKAVSGPSVAIMVNAPSCDLELDKTCCVTQPVLPDLDVCDGDVVRLVMEYTGEKCSASNNDQGRSFRCHGRREIGEPADITILNHVAEVTATPNTGVMIGDEVEFTSSTGTLFDKLRFKTTGPWWRKQYLKMDTSCERSIGCGDQFGAYKVVEIESTLGGLVDCSAPPPPPECKGPGDPAGTPCDAKLVDMVLEYNGQACQNPLGNPQNGEAQCDGDATGATNIGVIYTGQHADRQTISPASGINDGDLIRVTATWPGGLFPNQSLTIADSGGVLQTIDFHVSCSQPLALGDEFGSFKLVEFTTKTGFKTELGDGTDGTADACEVPLAPPGPHCTSDLKEITLVYIGDYLGQGCTVSNPQAGFGQCSGVADPGDPVMVIPGAGLDADPVDQIEFGDLVTLSPTSGGNLPTFTTLDVSGGGGTQWIQIKTDCYKPLSLGDRFGSFVVFGMDREDEGPITLGGNVQYQYEVTNPNLDQVDNVEITDSELGVIVSGVSLAPSEVQTFRKNATLFGTTTNVATVTGDVNGDFCDPAMDQVTVDVLAPPPGSFFCSEPIKELTMVWNGAQTVDIKAWKGHVGGTLLTEFDDVAPGDAVEVTGMTTWYPAPVWEIFESDGVTKIGESSFDLSCKDKSMNGIEDCGKNNGNGRDDDPGLVNDWLLEGMVDTDEVLECTPGLVPNPPACGFGPELILVLPGLLWLHRRRLGASK